MVTRTNGRIAGGAVNGAFVEDGHNLQDELLGHLVRIGEDGVANELDDFDVVRLVQLLFLEGLGGQGFAGRKEKALERVRQVGPYAGEFVCCEEETRGDERRREETRGNERARERRVREIDAQFARSYATTANVAQHVHRVTCVFTMLPRDWQAELQHRQQRVDSEFPRRLRRTVVLETQRYFQRLRPPMRT